MTIVYRVKWVLFGFAVGLVVSGFILAFAKYTYVNRISFLSNYRFNNKKSLMYFNQAIHYAEFNTGQFIHTAESQDIHNGHLYIAVNSNNINHYSILISKISARVCRFIVDMSYSSNIIKDVYINRKEIDRFQFQPISGRFLLVNGKAVSIEQNAYARRVCERADGRVQIRLEIMDHARED
ncbi:hypothetical protein ACMS1Z_05950 [Acidiphilium multivorum]|uniref:hypothetical protein n=1 Tax=Acidiphilium TaxID=522 RepID=UPI00258E7F3E|nr:hypothetical protein [Acidiphilium sp.]